MQKKHTKALIKLAKEDRDFDWGYLHDLVITKVRHMYEYYSKGYNVLQTDETRIPICVQLNHILQMQEEIDHLYESVDPTKLSSEASTDLLKKESELYKSIYKFISEHIEEW
jgi:hypothetical protein